jgi:L-cystine uptake protein TcyP (sodium:dicarboxylate symporter family)
MGSGDTNSFFNWSHLLGFIMYFIVPLVAIVAVIVVVNRIKDNPDIGNIVFSVATIVLIFGVAIAIFALPGKLNAAQKSSDATGALLSERPR